MGLDMNPLSRAKPGMAKEFAVIVRALTQQSGDDLPLLRGPDHPIAFHPMNAPQALLDMPRGDLIQRFQDLSDPHWETVGAPRVGYDPAADRWLDAKMVKNGRSGQAAQDTRDRMKGFYALDAMGPSDGFPLYTHAGLYDGVDRASFRGAFLDDVTDVLPQEVIDLAWLRMLPADLAAYGDILAHQAQQVATQHKLTKVLGKWEVPFVLFNRDLAQQIHIVDSLARWCRFWSDLGHGLDPYF